MNDTEFELSKMAVTTDVQGLGIGRKLMEHCMKAAGKPDKKDYLFNRRLYPPFLCMKNLVLRKCR
jgi:GNAT superfamily N-acetyltransferase